MNWLVLPKKIYFKPGAMAVALKELDEVYGFKKAFIVSDANLYRQGVTNVVMDFVRKRGISTAEFFSIGEGPSIEGVIGGLPKMLEFQPDVIIGVGGGSVMSAAKAMWLLYEDPEIDLAEVAKKHNTLEAPYDNDVVTGNKAKLVLVATTAGSGAECSPFSVLADEDGKKHVIASYSLVPEMAVIDPDFAASAPVEVKKSSGLTALTQAVRAYTSNNTSEFIYGFAREAVEGVLANLEDAVKGCPVATYKMANAAALAGMAFSSSVPTIDVEAGLYPSAAEKKAAKEEIALIADIARHAGFEGDDDKVFADFIAACEKLAEI